MLCILLKRWHAYSETCRERRRKTDPVFEALGDVDELNVAIGWAREYCIREGTAPTLVNHLTEIQSVPPMSSSRMIDTPSFAP
jgi:hypothetical protein